MPARKRRVMVFGTFDIVHHGHRSLFRQAKAYGEELVAVVARDETVRAVKGRAPHFGEERRLAAVKKEKLVDCAVLGDTEDRYAVIAELEPDVICLGYDQCAFVDQLPNELQKRGISAKVIRLESFRPERYKSTRIKARLVSRGRRPRATH